MQDGRLRIVLHSCDVITGLLLSRFLYSSVSLWAFIFSFTQFSSFAHKTQLKNRETVPRELAIMYWHHRLTIPTLLSCILFYIQTGNTIPHFYTSQTWQRKITMGEISPFSYKDHITKIWLNKYLKINSFCTLHKFI